jgi:hypothetical protein
MNPLLVEPALKLVGNIFDRIFPDKEQAQKAKQAFMAESAKLEQTETKEFHDFIVAYEGNGSTVSPLLQFLRGSVRPVLTYGLVILYGYGFIKPTEFTPENMQSLFQLNLISLGFWYGERALNNLGLNLGAKKQ